MSATAHLSDSPTKQTALLVSTASAASSSSDDIPSDSSGSQAQPKLKSILDNPNDVLPRKPSRSGSESGFKAALKATFLPPPAPGRPIKLKDGKRLGKTFQRTEPRSNKFQGGQVLDYDPRGKHASAGDGVLPPGCLNPPPQSRDSASESGYGSDTSDTADFSDLSRSNTSESSSAWASSHRGGVSTRARQASIASTTSSTSSGAAIKFCPLPASGRLKRANSITIGVAARSQLLRSQGTSAPPRQHYMPQHVHGSQAWYTHPQHDHVVDVGEEIKKGATKAWKLLRGGAGNSSDTSSSKAKDAAAVDPGVQSNATAMPDKPKKAFPKEGAPIADPETGELKMADGSDLSHGQVSEQTKNPPAAGAGGDQTPRRASSPTTQLRSMSISEDPEAEDAATALEAAHAKNAAKHPHLPNGHHPHDLQDGPHHHHFHLADEHDATHLDSGTATPRSGMQRRLSTGAFLRGLSIRGIQEDRRRDLLGLDQHGEAEVAAAEGKTSGEHHRHGIAVRTPAGKEEELGLEGYGHSRQILS
ncbi:uncharacterized protein SRS1_10775 [Sporisorium reilianum f. sp. reilianum]|uniref:Uncharacterized protein n=1 Tax=Sporisorium reilianum f. sp. reilianum TaxID=72559 RepID=A0A2N8UCY9_9BASI|nr:uncharacterized protein SRS1_10775 [Sporisorium reilianum f. sp. reilianum]